MKLYDRPKIDKTLDRLPELPEGVEVPDDISGLHPPTTLRPTGGAIRWMRWLAAIVVFGAVAVLAALAINADTGTAMSDGSDYTAVGGTPYSVVFEPAELYVSSWVPGRLEVLANLGADRVAVDYIAMYGTDNPVFVEEAVVVVPTPLMELFGTDNPVFVLEAVDTSTMEQYGTDNPVAVRGVVTSQSHMERYGTDNPVFVRPAEHPYAEFYG